MFDRTTSGSPLKWLSIVDEYTRECLALKVDRIITAEDGIDTLVELFAMRGVPGAIRRDHGPEFVAQAIPRWLALVGEQTISIAPGSPWENGFAESFHSRLSDEILATELLESQAAAQRPTTARRTDNNKVRSHSSLGYVTPAEFASGCAASATAAAPLQKHSGLSVTQTLLTTGTGI